MVRLRKIVVNNSGSEVNIILSSLSWQMVVTRILISLGRVVRFAVHPFNVCSMPKMLTISVLFGSGFRIYFGATAS